jgi:LCP family protein required for cell wall assembly
MMAIPRDLYTRIPEERLSRMRGDGLRPPNTLKINAMRSYGRAYGIFYLLEQLGEMLGIDFDYYAEVELRDFTRIIDTLGGVWMDVPERMFYEDPEQDLYINIAPGMQRFGGKEAEGLVRFRSYPSGDLGRNAVQMEFIKQLIRQSLTKEAIMRDPMAIINFILKDIRHNVGVDAIRYLPYVTELRSENIISYTMPGNGQYVNGISYFVADNSTLANTVEDVFYAGFKKQNDEPAEEKPSHGLKIQVLNGSRVAGYGSDFADMLKSEGYTVSDTGIQPGTHENTSRIWVRENGIGEDLIPYFKNVIIESNREIPTEYDMVIILGRGEH